MDLVHEQRVAREDVAALEPAPRDAGGDDHHVPRRRLRRRLALAIDDAHAQLVRAEDRLGDRADRERLPRARAGDDAESRARAREIANLRAVLALEERLEPQVHRQLDRLARRAGRRDDDDASRRRFSGEERFVIWWEVVVADAPKHAAQMLP